VGDLKDGVVKTLCGGLEGWGGFFSLNGYWIIHVFQTLDLALHEPISILDLFPNFIKTSYTNIQYSMDCLHDILRTYVDNCYWWLGNHHSQGHPLITNIVLCDLLF
jgi:hypothetical protein